MPIIERLRMAAAEQFKSLDSSLMYQAAFALEDLKSDLNSLAKSTDDAIVHEHIEKMLQRINKE